MFQKLISSWKSLLGMFQGTQKIFLLFLEVRRAVFINFGIIYPFSTSFWGAVLVTAGRIAHVLLYSVHCCWVTSFCFTLWLSSLNGTTIICMVMSYACAVYLPSWQDLWPAVWQSDVCSCHIKTSKVNWQIIVGNKTTLLMKTIVRNKIVCSIYSKSLSDNINLGSIHWKGFCILH